MTRPPSRTALAAGLLGLLQGPAEVLPISSSAHVELIAGRLGLAGEARKELAVALHAGSAAALLASGIRPRRLGWAAVTVAVPSAIGLALERAVEERLGSPEAMAAGLVVGSLALVAADASGPRSGTGPRGSGRPARARRGRRPAVTATAAPFRRRGRAAESATVADALALGAAQACALWPGVSRSGAVLAAARARGFSRPAAWALVRETAVPVLVAATTLKGARALARGADPRPPAAGAAASALSTAAALRAAGAAERVPAGAWALYRFCVAGAVLAVRETSAR